MDADFSSSGSFSLSPGDYSSLIDSINELEQGAHQQLNSFPVFDNIVNFGAYNQIRTGVIQDPNFDPLADRYDEEGTLRSTPYSMIDETEKQYPFNGLNSVDPFGMRVSIVWLDGLEGGMYHGTASTTNPQQVAKIKAQVGKPAQKIWITSSNSWSDLDRSCGRFHLPLPGTICRIGMVRGDVGVILGTIPLDKANIPLLRLGDDLVRHFNQSSMYMTDLTLQNAYKDVLDKDIHKPELILEPRPGTEEHPKPYETDENVLTSLRDYIGHRFVISSDGVSTSSKITSGQHSSIDNKRTLDWDTRLGLADAIAQWKATITLENITSGHIVSPEGDLRFSQNSDTKHSIELTTKMTLNDALTLIRNNFYPTSVRIVSRDAILEFSCEATTTTPSVLSKASLCLTSSTLSVSSIATTVAAQFNTILTHSADIRASDTIFFWCRQSGISRSSTTFAAVQLAAIETIMGRPGKFYEVYGPDVVLVGNHNIVNCPPPPVIPVDTCDVPFTN